MANDQQGGIQAIFKLSARPQCEIVQKHDQTIDLEPETLSTRVYIAECSNCQLVLKKKTANVLIEKCQDLVLTMDAELVSGTLEVFKSSKICIQIRPNIKVWLLSVIQTVVLYNISFVQYYICYFVRDVARGIPGGGGGGSLGCDITRVKLSGVRWGLIKK